MAAVLTTSMSLRIILSVRGSLEHGGSFALSGSSHSRSSHTTPVVSTRSGGLPTNISTSLAQQNTFDLGHLRSKPEADWVDGKSSVMESETKPGILDPAVDHDSEHDRQTGVKIRIEREVYDPYDHTDRK